MKATRLALAITLALAACGTLPTDPAGDGTRPTMAPQKVSATGTAVGTFVALEDQGIRGGALSVHLPASVDQVFDALLDFEGANGHRSWAESFELLETEADQHGPRRVARWNFRGKLGVKPSVTLEFRPQRTTTGAQISFQLLEGALGLRTFEGCYELFPAADGSTLFTQRVFMSSGLAFVDASHEDIAAGLRKDAERLADWLVARTMSVQLESPAS